MIESIKSILTVEFENLKQELIAKYNEAANPSGDWPQTFEASVSGTKAQLTAANYIYGREPGKQPPSAAIEEWILNKGIAAQAAKKISISSLAYLIARKIGMEGWKPKDNSGESIITAVITPERLQLIADRAGDEVLFNISFEIIDYLKKIAA